MKTTKISTAIATLSLVLSISFSSVAGTGVSATGDIVKSDLKKQITATENVISNLSFNFEKEFDYLRFDVNKFTYEESMTELPTASLNYLRFDVNRFIYASGTEITELPLDNDFDYLRFDVINFTGASVVEIGELPVE